MLPLSRTDLGDLSVFMEVARCRSFTRAASLLDVSTSALSHAVRNLETRLGVRLLNRTARSVTLTEAGERLLARLEAGFREIGEAVEDLNLFREGPVGRLRLNVPNDAARLILAPILADYARQFPGVSLDIMVDNAMVDVFSAGFDAGIRYGNRVPQDMVAAPLGRDLAWVTVASPSYLAAHGRPRTPEDLHRHASIGLRLGDGSLYHWELGDGESARTVELRSSIVVNETQLAIDAALRGAGIAYCLAAHVRAELASGALERVLPEWTSHGPAFHVYYPSRRQVPDALRRLIELARVEMSRLDEATAAVLAAPARPG